MQYKHGINKYLPKSKDKMTLKAYKARYYEAIRLVRHEEGEFDAFLKGLYKLDSESYDLWHKELRNIPYSFVRNNVELMAILAKDNELELAKEAFEMFKKQESLICRCIPMRASVTTVNGNKEKLLLELQRAAAALHSELVGENTLRKSQEEFALAFGQYEDDPYLGEYYDSIIDGFEGRILSEIDSEVNKIAGISGKLTASSHVAAVVDDITHYKRNHKPSAYFKHHSSRK